MLAGRALRHQMILPEQQYLYDYWRSKCRNGRLPCREDIDPSDIQSHLPMVSLVEVQAGNAQPRYRFRLAGTGFWALYQDEITGKYIDELPIGNRVAYWHRVLGRVVEQGRPSAGVTRPGTPSRSHLAQFWIRLPLVDSRGEIKTIIGFDHMVNISEMTQSPQIQEKITA